MLNWDENGRDYRDMPPPPPLGWRDGLRSVGEALALGGLLWFLLWLAPLALEKAQTKQGSQAKFHLFALGFQTLGPQSFRIN